MQIFRASLLIIIMPETEKCIALDYVIEDDD